jgi:acid stress-induced BolA-like protein IbaG/YrbA
MTDAPSILDQLRTSIEEAIPGAIVQVDSGSGGHYTLDVTSEAFEGKNRVQAQRLVLSSIAHLMKGDAAPVHAIDSLKTRTP